MGQTVDAFSRGVVEGNNRMTACWVLGRRQKVQRKFQAPISVGGVLWSAGCGSYQLHCLL